MKKHNGGGGGGGGEKAQWGGGGDGVWRSYDTLQMTLHVLEMYFVVKKQR